MGTSKKFWQTDEFEIAIHVALNCVILAAGWKFGYLWAAIAFNLAFWPGRELYQRHAKGQHLWEIFTRPQVLLEWVPGAAINAVVAVLSVIY